MSTAAPERTLDDVITDLDLDERLRDAVPPPTCEMYVDNAPCGAPAAWVHVPTCGHGVYSCESCKARYVALIALKRMSGPVDFLCGKCGTKMSVTEWRPL